MATHGCVPLIIRDDKDDIGLFAKGGIGCVKRNNRACKDQANGEEGKDVTIHRE